MQNDVAGISRSNQSLVLPRRVDNRRIF